ncbi:MAG: cysteine hydrolase [Firmicutes bacterium]|nr:cysteine hydrolase [Bacillota bacterium]
MAEREQATGRVAWSEFGAAVDEWFARLPERGWSELAPRGGQRVAVCVVDMLNGFAREGPLASPRVEALVPPVLHLVENAAARGARIVAVQDCHPRGAVEFGAYPPHCLEGTSEAEAVEELLSLPAYREARLVRKNNLCGLWAGDWYRDLVAEGVDTFVICGDCTDLCVNYLAMPLRLWANERNLPLRVVVPAEAVDTFDIPARAASTEEPAAPGHPGELFHRLFLYHMAQNGVEVVRRVTF